MNQLVPTTQAADLAAEEVPPQPNRRPQDWELLVTDGHVRAARIRHAQPFIAGLGALLTAAGLTAVLFSPISKAVLPFLPKPQTVYENFVTEANSKRTAAVNQILSIPPAPTLALSPDQIRADMQAGRLGSTNDIPGVQADIEKALNDNGKLPADYAFAEMAASTFWRGTWPGGIQIATVTGAKTRLFGLVAINEGSGIFGAPTHQAVRWLAAARLTNGRWKLHHLSTGYVPQGAIGIDPSTVALSLANPAEE